MKKLLSLLFILLLFASCEKEVEKPKENTPEVNEEKIAQPIKPEIVEPEVVEPETTDLEEIVLPEADENTITITIDFPEDFPETPYTEPELVSPEEFEWGEYVPFVRYQDERYGRYLYIYKYAFLAEHTENLDEAHSLYDKFNDIYAINLPQQNGTLGICGDVSLPENEYIKDYLFKSRLIFISENLDNLGRFYLVYADENKDGNLSNDKWNNKYEFIENGKVIFENETNEVDDLSENKYISLKKYLFYDFKKQKNCLLSSNENLVYINESLAISEILQPAKDSLVKTYCLYSLDDNSIISKFELIYQPEKENNKHFYIKQIVDNRYLLLYCVSNYSSEETPLVDFYSAHYLYDLVTNEMTLISRFSEEDGLLSPDAKYFIYTAPTEKAQLISNFNNLENMKNGFYIKNLSSQTTIFFEGDSEKEYYIQNWINKEKLYSNINK